MQSSLPSHEHRPTSTVLSTESSKTLGVLTLNADFIRKCFTSNSPPPMTPELAGNKERKPGHEHFSVDLAKLGSLARDVIVQNCPSLLRGLVSSANRSIWTWIQVSNPPTPPNHCQPISNLESIKAALDIYEATGQLVRVSQPTKWIFNPHQTKDSCGSV